MPTLTFYLLFTGNCKQAMEFYQSCFGGELTLTQVGESAVKTHMPVELHDKIIYAQLVSETIRISASDWLMPNRTAIQGNTVCLYLTGGSFEELAGYFNKLSASATLIDPLAEHFAGSYGALTDSFGVRWMFHTEQKA